MIGYTSKLVFDVSAKVWMHQRGKLVLEKLKINKYINET